MVIPNPSCYLQEMNDIESLPGITLKIPFLGNPLTYLAGILVIICRNSLKNSFPVNILHEFLFQRKTSTGFLEGIPCPLLQSGQEIPVIPKTPW